MRWARIHALVLALLVFLGVWQGACAGEMSGTDWAGRDGVIRCRLPEGWQMESDAAWDAYRAQLMKLNTAENAEQTIDVLKAEKYANLFAPDGGILYMDISKSSFSGFDAMADEMSMMYRMMYSVMFDLGLAKIEETTIGGIPALRVFVPGDDLFLPFEEYALLLPGTSKLVSLTFETASESVGALVASISFANGARWVGADGTLSLEIPLDYEVAEDPAYYGAFDAYAKSVFVTVSEVADGETADAWMAASRMEAEYRSTNTIDRNGAADIQMIHPVEGAVFGELDCARLLLFYRPVDEVYELDTQRAEYYFASADGKKVFCVAFEGENPDVEAVMNSIRLAE